MIRNVIINYLKRYKYIFASLLILFFCTLVLYNYYKKKDIYILYDNFKDCHNVKEYQRATYYGICYKNDEIFFEKNINKKEYGIKDITKFELISKDEFFKINFNRFKDINLFLIVKKDSEFVIVLVKPIKIIS